MWVADDVRNSSRSIAIKMDGEEPGQDGKTPLRGITLNRDATIIFDQHFDNTLFIGYRIAVLIRSQESLTEDLADGKGLKGSQYLRGVDFTYRQPKLG